MVDSSLHPTSFPLPVYRLLPLLLWVLSLDTLAFPAADPSRDRHASFASAAGDRRDPRSRDLADHARTAARTLAERQVGPGYWTTAFTDEALFEKPRQEKNTFTNAVMIDLLDPIAQEAGVTALLGRTRAFLADQIEADGLVRYHGRPGVPASPEIWSCEITPDADDTALVWRIAPGGNRELLSQALATLGRFRAANGLYKTWLAPQDGYQCIDPGRDPNPTDIGIQMNVHMLLAQVDRPAAMALCEALARESSGDSVWVYYGAMAPLIPMLRLGALHRAGCALTLPQARTQTSVAGQAVWLEAVRLLGRMERSQATALEYSRVGELLHGLAADGFSPIRIAPPLLYHNDFTARVRRFYWSEDVGYALWLRLHFERQRARPELPGPAPA